MSPESTRSGCGPLLSGHANPPPPLRQRIFEHVRAAGLISRIELSKALGVSPASVTTLTSELIEGGLLEEVPRDTGEPGRGRPPVALGVRATAGYVIGIKLSDHELTGVIVDLAGNVIASHQVPCADRPHGTRAFVEICARLIDTLMDTPGISRDRIAAVGIGVPGFVRRDRGEVIWSPLLAERDVMLAATASARLGYPVVIENDANLVTLAELWFGKGREIADFAVVTIEHGVGMGFVTGHRLYSGGNGLGMELGHTKVRIDGALCRCGQRGCLEAYVADYALAREAETALDVPEPLSAIEVLLREAKAGNPTARGIFRRAGRYLSQGLANMANVLDPSLILLSGGEMRYEILIAEEMLADMSQMLLNTGEPGPRIEVHAWDDLVWARGAAALALSEMTDRVLPVRRAAE